MGPVCACGCGEYLPENSTRNYKRGHKSRSSDSAFFAGSDTIEDNGEFTIFHAAQNTPNDPEPAELAKQEYSAPIKITANVRKDIEGKLAFLFGMTANMMQLADPVCGGVMLEHSANIAKKLTPILCQSPAVVKWFRTGTSYIMYLDFLMACTPVFGSIYAHHLIARKNAEALPDVPFTQQYYGVS